MMHILEDAEALLAEGLDAALIGYTVGDNVVAVYDYEKCIQVLMKANKWSYEEAQEWMDYNVLGSYHGDKTPIFIARD